MKVPKCSTRLLLPLLVMRAALACAPAGDVRARAEPGDSTSLPASVTTDVTLAPNGAFIVPAEYAPSVLQQCSRATPPAPESFWTPTPAEIAAVDRRLLGEVRPAFWARWRDNYAGVDPPELRPPRYVRQYVGLAYGQRRVFYGNGFMPHMALSTDSAERSWYGAEGEGADSAVTDSARASLRERIEREGYVVCDGGEWYFGIEYEPARRQFRNLQFNGPG